MEVLLAIGIAVMVSMVADPPQRSVLAGENAEQREYELELPAGLERSVSEQAVVTRRDAEQLHPARDKKCCQSGLTDAGGESEAATEMEQDQREHEREMARQEGRYIRGLSRAHGCA